MFRLAILALWLCSPLSQAAERLMLWEATGKQGTVYLFGSIHVCKAACFPLDESITSRLAASDALVLELDTTRAGIQSVLMSAAMLPAGESLQNKLPPDDWQRLKHALESEGLPLQGTERLRPWMLGLLLSIQAAQRSGFEVSQGIDFWMLKRAKELGKPILELETPERQIAAISSGSEQEQMDALRLLVEQHQRGRLPAMFEALRRAWATGDETALLALLKEGTPAGSSMTHELIERRNAEMTEKLLEFQRQAQQLFVVVGAAHLVGPAGIPARMAQKGFTLRQLAKGE